MTSPEAPDSRPVAGAPYGPATPAIRRFLVQLATLDAASRDAVVARFDAASRSRPFALADAALAETIERSGRSDAQEALAGPLLQMARRSGDRAQGDTLPPEGDVPDLEAFAEPALAALLALLVRDLLSPAHFRVLYGPFDETIPVEGLGS